MPMVLVRRPRSANAAKLIVKREVRAAWKDMGDKLITQLNDDVSDWQEKPEFKVTITLGHGKWTFVIKYDKRTLGGKRYKFVDEGTASYAGKAPYTIEAKEADYLHFYTPNYPRTLPGVGTNSRPTTHLPTEGEQEERFAKSVIHPGVRPRNFTESLREMLRKPGSGSFKNVTDAAIKRGLRKIGE